MGVGVIVVVAVAVAVGVGVGVPLCTVTQAENSDVSIGAPPASSLVAVAATTMWPAGSGKLTGPKVALQFPSVVTFVEPRNVWPSPNPDGSHDTLEKNSSRKLVFGTLFSVPEIVTIPPPNEADVITGKF